MHTIILDTDIGSDVDDALALATVLGSESVNLLGIILCRILTAI